MKHNILLILPDQLRGDWIAPFSAALAGTRHILDMEAPAGRYYERSPVCHDSVNMPLDSDTSNSRLANTSCDVVTVGTMYQKNTWIGGTTARIRGTTARIEGTAAGIEGTTARIEGTTARIRGDDCEICEDACGDEDQHMYYRGGSGTKWPHSDPEGGLVDAQTVHIDLDTELKQLAARYSREVEDRREGAILRQFRCHHTLSKFCHLHPFGDVEYVRPVASCF
jgi:hypothetical protein